jgi:hypothetical protein
MILSLGVAAASSAPAASVRSADYVTAEVVSLDRGDGVIFAVHHRPVRGTRGYYRVNLRHGVSKLRSGHRHCLGIIFHDAQ